MPERELAVDATFTEVDLSVLPRVRGLARHATADLPDDGGHREAVELVVAELVGNAVLHGRAPVRLAIGREVDGTAVAVYDAAPEVIPLRRSPRRPGHFGLDIVDVLTGGVQVDVHDLDKCISVFVPLRPWPGRGAHP